MSNLLNIHNFDLLEALSGYELPCATYVLFRQNPLLPDPGWFVAVTSRYWAPSENECGS